MSAPHRPEPGESSPLSVLQRWWKRLTAIILTSGALAGAVAAMLSFLPSDQEVTATLTPLGLTRMPITEYKQRSVVLKPASAESSLRATVSPAPTALRPAAASASGAEPQQSATPDDQTTPSTSAASPDETSTPDSTTTSNTESTSPTTSQTSQSTATASQSTATSEKPFKLDQDVISDEVKEGLPTYYLPAKNIPIQTLQTASLQRSPLGPSGQVVASNEEAADIIVAVLKQTRTISHGSGRKVEPVGVRVSVNVEISGLDGETVYLLWSVLTAEGDPLPVAWQRLVAGYELEPTSNRDVANLDFWVPLPADSGTYYVTMILQRADGSRLVGADTKTFH